MQDDQKSDEKFESQLQDWDSWRASFAATKDVFAKIGKAVADAFQIIVDRLRSAGILPPRKPQRPDFDRAREFRAARRKYAHMMRVHKARLGNGPASSRYKN